MISSENEHGSHNTETDANRIIVMTQVEEDDGEDSVEDGIQFD